MKVLRMLGSLALAVSLLLGSFFLLEKSEAVYHALTRFSGVYEQVELPEKSIHDAVSAISDYMNHRSSDLLVEFEGKSIFAAQEVFHMFEVRGIFDGLWKFFLLCLSLGALSLARWKKQLLRAQFYWMMGLLGFFALSAAFFEKAFLWMHLKLFDNPYWAFSNEHYLTQLLPESFFLYFLVLTILLALILSLGLYLVGRKEKTHA